MKNKYLDMEKYKKAKIMKLIYYTPRILFYRNKELYIDEDYYYVYIF